MYITDFWNYVYFLLCNVYHIFLEFWKAYSDWLNVELHWDRTRSSAAFLLWLAASWHNQRPRPRGAHFLHSRSRQRMTLCSKIFSLYQLYPPYPPYPLYHHLHLYPANCISIVWIFSGWIVATHFVFLPVFLGIRWLMALPCFWQGITSKVLARRVVRDPRSHMISTVLCHHFHKPLIWSQTQLQ